MVSVAALPTGKGVACTTCKILVPGKYFLTEVRSAHCLHVNSQSTKQCKLGLAILE